MLFSLLSGARPSEIIINLLLTIPAVIIALVFHETAHGWVAWKLGDPTAHNLGRLTLNPAKHLDPIGSLMMFLVGFGWAKPVPINTRYFRNPKRDIALSAAAGPAANLLLGLFFAALYGFFWAFYSYAYYSFEATGIWFNVAKWSATMFYYCAVFNFVFMLFNLIPIPSFDGSRIFYSFLPTKYYFAVMRYERQIMMGFLLVMVICSYIFDFSPFGWAAEKLTTLIAEPIGDALWERIFVTLL